GAANHRGPTDVNILNCVGQCHLWFGDGSFERVQIHNHHVDRLKAAFARFGLVLWVAALEEKTAMHTRMQRLDPTVENLWKSGEFGILAHRNLFLPQKVRRSASGNDVHTLPLEPARKRSNTGFVGDGN